MSRKRLFVRIEFLSLAIIGFLAHGQVSAQPLKLNRGDHVSYIGNTLTDRMHSFKLHKPVKSTHQDSE